MADELAGQIVSVAQLSGTFVLRSGRTADTYFDKYRFEADPRLLAEVAAGLAGLVPEGIEVLAGLELGGVAIAVALAREVGLPCAFVRKAAKPYGTRRLGEGAEIAGRRVLVVEDVVTSGGQVVTSTADLRQLGATVDHALCVIDRQEGGTAALADHGLTLLSLFTRADLEAAKAPADRPSD